MHLPNDYETEWINLLDVESSPSKYWPMSIYQVGVTSVCYVYKKNSYLDDFLYKLLMIPHTNFELFDDSTHEYCIHTQRLSILTEYLSHSLTHFTPTNLAVHLFRSLGLFLFKRKLVVNCISHVGNVSVPIKINIK